MNGPEERCVAFYHGAPCDRTQRRHGFRNLDHAFQSSRSARSGIESKSAESGALVGPGGPKDQHSPGGLGITTHEARDGLTNRETRDPISTEMRAETTGSLTVVHPFCAKHSNEVPPAGCPICKLDTLRQKLAELRKFMHCDYVYPGNHRRCRRPMSWHERGPRGFNITVDNHDFVRPRRM